MAEQEPQAPETEEKVKTTADRLQAIDAQLAELDAQEAELQRRREELLEKKAWEADVWGANDAAQDGEATNDYAKYLESRPKNGIVRNEEGVPVNTKTGRRAKEGAYEAQNGDTKAQPFDYYDRFTGGNETFPDYESLSYMQLAREVNRARVFNDQATEKYIRDIVDARLIKETLEDKNVNSRSSRGREGVDAYEERLQERLAQFDKYVEKLPDTQTKRVDKVIDTETETPTEGFGEEMKKWGASLKRVVSEAGVTKWAQRWSESLRGNLDAILDRGVDQNASEEEKEQKRNENRRKSKLGDDAQAGASVPEETHESGAESLEPRLEGEHLPRKEYEVKSGDKLIDLFRELGLDASNVDKKYRRFVGTRQHLMYPNELRLDSDGSIRFVKTGKLSKPLQAHLERLRYGGES